MKTKKIPRTFNLKGAKKDANTPQSIRMILSIGGVKYVYYTGFSIEPKFWNQKTRRAKTNVAYMGAIAINKGLNKLEEELDKAFDHLLITEQSVTRDAITDWLDQYTGKKERKMGDFWSFVECFIEGSKERINPETGLKISPETIRKYKDCKRVFKEFEMADNRKMRFDNLNLEWFDRFNRWCIEKDYSVNSIDKFAECLRTWLNKAVKDGETKNLDYKQIKTRPQDSTAIYLTEDEIKKIHKAKVIGKYHNARDLFLLGCFTGLRYSDTSTIKKEHIDKKKEKISIHQAKTGDLVTIPMHPILKDILEKRNWQPPYSISNQKLNEYIKIVCEKAKIKDNIEVQITKSGERKKKFVPKWKLVSTHTARRSFASNLYKAGIPPQTIMKLTGHKTLTAFLAYIRLSDTEHFEMIENLWKKEKK